MTVSAHPGHPGTPAALALVASGPTESCWHLVAAAHQTIEAAAAVTVRKDPA